MERRSFLKGLIGVAVSLSPAVSFLEKLSIAPDPIINQVIPVIDGVKPFIISFTNKSSEIIRSIDAFGSFKYLASDMFDSNNKLFVQYADISCGNDTTYNELLRSLMYNPVTFGKMILMSDNNMQLNTSISIKSYSANGMTAEKQINSNLDYNNDTSKKEVNSLFMIDGFTELKIGQLLPKTRLDVYLYPATEVSRGLKQ